MRDTPAARLCLHLASPPSGRLASTACLSGTWQYNSSLAESVVSLGLKLGFTHIDTANDYKNQDGVGRALVRAPPQPQRPPQRNSLRLRLPLP